MLLQKDTRQRLLSSRQMRETLTASAAGDLCPSISAAAAGSHDELRVLERWPVLLRAVAKRRRRSPRAKVLWSGACLSESHRWCVFTDESGCCAKWWIVYKIKSQRWDKTCLEYERDREEIHRHSEQVMCVTDCFWQWNPSHEYWLA